MRRRSHNHSKQQKRPQQRLAVARSEAETGAAGNSGDGINLYEDFEGDGSGSAPLDDDNHNFWAWALLVPVAVAWRVLLSLHLPIMDCDEVFNYWEPLHYMLFPNETPKALQTWEYAHEYSLRSYAFLMPLKLLGQVYVHILEELRLRSPHSPISSSLYSLLHKWFVPSLSSPSILGNENNANNDSIIVFFMLRATMAIVTTLAELFWFRTLLLQTSRPLVVPRRVVIVMVLLALSLPGSNVVSASLLPSSAYAVGWLLASSFMVRRNHHRMIVTAIVLTLATGWPFGAVMFVPMGLRVLWLQHRQGGIVQLSKVLGFCVLVTVLTQLVVCAVDGYYYHDDFFQAWRTLLPVIATYNIFKYNAVGGGDSMYGTEPVSYYVKNLLLNLNLVAPLGAGALLVHGCSQRINWDVWTCLCSLVPWILITFPRSHKEERFLFPIYPILVTGAAMVADATLNAIGRVEAGLSRHKCLSRKQRLVLESLVWIPVVVLGLGRTMALAKYYSAPLHAYTALHAQLGPHDTVCTCGEWYRFPSSFFLANTDQPLRFLPCSFTGQLPQPFVPAGSRPSGISQLQPFHSDNTMNVERFAQLEDCDWVVELQAGSGDCNVTLPDDSDDAIVFRYPFLNAAATSTLNRVLYVPGWHEAAIRKGSVQYHDYVVYKLKP
jgi:alpha-1,2-mannosyltransferase